jgi:hypothetical protein
MRQIHYTIPTKLIYESADFVVVASADNEPLCYEIARVKEQRTAFLTGALAKALFDTQKVWETHTPYSQEVDATLDYLTHACSFHLAVH